MSFDRALKLMTKVVLVEKDIFQPMSWDEFLSKKGHKNKDGSWDIDGDVDLSNLGLKKLPVRFRKVGGGFDCENNKLTTLEGAPVKVGGGFHCENNNLTTLEGAPKKVGGYFNCSYNKLTTLEGAPKKVGGYFHCFHNPVSIKDLKKTVKRDYL